MKREKFEALWNCYSDEWINNASFKDEYGEKKSVSDFCRIKYGYGAFLHKRYEIIKAEIKKAYFGKSDKKLNRHKRAAVIVYAISSSDPLEYTAESEYRIDRYFLKQRLAFYVGLGAILQDYSKTSIEQIGTIFHFPALIEAEEKIGADDFLTGVYKDIFFSEIHYNYNVLTMANLFWLIENQSKLKQDMLLPV